jgi:hypothetical protein
MSLHSERKCAMSAGGSELSVDREAMQTQRQSRGAGSATTVVSRLGDDPAFADFSSGFDPLRRAPPRRRGSRLCGGGRKLR